MKARVSPIAIQKGILMNKTQVMAQLQIDEGFSPRAYFDNDQFTYGYGTKAPGKGAAISEEEALKALSTRVDLAIADFYVIYAGCSMTERRQHALVNMCFNLGGTKLRKFHGMNDAVRANDWPRAGAEAKDSHWFLQLSKPNNGKEERSERIVREILEG